MTEIKYNGLVVVNFEGGNTATLPVKDKMMKSDIIVTVPEPEEVVLQEKTVTANGEVTADEGYDGLSKVIVNVPSREPILEEIVITKNGEYIPNGDGYSKVIVAVSAEIIDSPLPIEVSTEAEMTALLTSGEVGSVYKYTGTTGTYENGALYLLEATDEPDKPDTPDEPEQNTFTFTVSGETYTADNGMNWYQWANSKYCNETSSCETEESKVYIRTKTLILDLDGKAVIGREPITKGGIYKSKKENEYVEPNTFTINGVEYTMDGLTRWYDWCKNMDYNTDNFQCASVNDYVYEAETRNTVIDENGDEVIGASYISEGRAYLIKKHTFSFTIDGETYTADSDMNWYRWANSSYSPDSCNCYSTDSYVYWTISSCIFDSNGNIVKGSYLITEGGVYSVKPYESSTFTFTIDGTSYTAEEGMRWREWLESDYNTGGFWEDGSDGVYSSKNERVYLDDTMIIATMDIIANASYYS